MKSRLEAVTVEVAVLIDSERSAPAEFIPISDTNGQFRSAVQRVVGNESAVEVQLLPSGDRVVEVLLERPLTLLGDIRIVHLNFVGYGLRDGRPEGSEQKRKEGDAKRRASTTTLQVLPRIRKSTSI